MTKGIIWNEEYSAKVKMLDEQHKQIISIINDLYTPILAGKNELPIKRTLSRLQIYTETHFRYEETLLRLAKYSELKEHSKSHEEMIKKSSRIYFSC